MKSPIIYVARALMQCAFAEQKRPEITGTVSFNVVSRCGRMTRGLCEVVIANI